MATELTTSKPVKLSAGTQTNPENGDKLPTPAPKRPHKRSYQTTPSGPRIQHLKKRDGEALWRKDIQYDFLNAVFTDTTRAFTSNTNPAEKLTFADIYLKAMAESSRCSKILGEKLLCDRQAGIKIAMVCLLVNLGRMNTTLNFFPEMKTQLRTYHPIPSLQTHDTQDYKQLQDAPRLKSILKGACEGPNEPKTLKEIREMTHIPRTNPISLVFLMSTWAHEVKYEMFPKPLYLSYFDLIVDTTKTSHSRARAFLWLVWAYTESAEFEHSTNNPFGSSFPFPDPIDPTNTKFENVDTPAELVFGNQMTLQRLAILNNSNDHESKSSADQNSSTDPSTVPHTSTSATSSGHDKAHDKSSVALAVPKLRLRSAKDRRVNDELNSLVRQKRSARRVQRLKRKNAVRDTWRFIGDLDPMYNSDDDISKAKVNGKSHGVGLGVQATGLKSKYADYGEHCTSQALALKRIAKKITDGAASTKLDNVEPVNIKVQETAPVIVSPIATAPAVYPGAGIKTENAQMSLLG